MQLSQTSEYALRAMAVVKNLQAGESIRAADLAEVADVPIHYLSKVMRQLVVEGLVESRKGHGGGFRLAKPASKIRLADILAVGDVPADRSECAFGWSVCDKQRPCPLHDAWRELKDGYQKWATETRLDQIGSADFAYLKLAAKRSGRKK